MRENYLSIGSVVMLKGAEVPLMVDTIAMFNHDQI